MYFNIIFAQEYSFMCDEMTYFIYIFFFTFYQLKQSIEIREYALCNKYCV